MKTHLQLLRLFATLIFVAVASLSWAYDFEVDGIYYNWNGNGVSVTHKDDSYNSYSNGVIIPSAVMYAGLYYNVTDIGPNAFSGCSDLTYVSIPNSVTSIGAYAFESCSKLTSITIPESVMTIGSGAFRSCTILSSVTIPDSVTSIGNYAFFGCSSLPVENNIRYADTYLVEAVDKSQSSYDIKKGTRFIGNEAFAECSSMTSINIPEGVTSIGHAAFWGCSNIKNVTCLVTSSNKRAGNLDLTPVEEPEKPAPGIEPSKISEIIEQYYYPFNPAHNSEDDPPTTANCEETTDVTINNIYTEAEINSLWLDYYKKVYNTRTATIKSNNKVNLLRANPLFIRGNSVVSIGQYKAEWEIYYQDLAAYEQYQCNIIYSHYPTVPMPDASIDVFNGVELANAKLYVYEDVIEAYKVSPLWNKFGEIVGITNPAPIRINENDVRIQIYEKYQIKTTVLSNKSVTWESSNTDVVRVDEYGIVTGVSAGTATITIKMTDGTERSASCDVTVENNILSGKCGENVNYELRDGVCLVISGTGKMDDYDSASNTPWYNNRGEINSVEIGDFVTSIGNSAFSGCFGLTSIIIPKDVTSIGSEAFMGCPFRTIVSKQQNPEGFTNAFSTQVYNHTPLYVPQNTYWDYVFNSEWYRFLHIKEFATEEVQARQAYMLADTKGTNFVVYNAGNDTLEEKEYVHQVDESSLSSNWVVENMGSKAALLNLGANKYASIDAEGRMSLSESPQALDITFDNGVAEVNGRQMMMVINDNEEVTAVVTLRGETSVVGEGSDSNAPIYDLSGRRLTEKPKRGLYIQGGKVKI